VILDLDLIRLRSGEILTVYGTYEGNVCRARLTFIADPNGDRRIKGEIYRKVTVNQHGEIPNCEKVLDLPGEEHYLVARSEIESIFPARDGFLSLTREEDDICKSLINLLQEECQIDPTAHGLGGSSALGCRKERSDFDWVLYDDTAVGRLEEYIQQSKILDKVWPFTAEYAVSKYKGITTLSKADILTLFRKKRKYFGYRGRAFSVSVVSRTFFADKLLRLILTGEIDRFSGTIINGTTSHFMPRILAVRTPEGRIVEVLSWLFLYSGAFHDGDVVEVVGAVADVKARRFIAITRREHYIRIAN